ncbi:hypothetical protein AOB60_36945 [Streptomyces noursei]|uniref:Transposase n=1 Tax=Streptomyces noursei TaxID=1971 RepID=A0A2N8P7E1_STRNR|nr:hypothetical protein AOB60_36945 [Streptomyces noursei]
MTQDTAVTSKDARSAPSDSQQAINRTHTKIRAVDERAMATPKNRRLPRKLRCSTTHITSTAQAVPTLHLNTPT